MFFVLLLPIFIQWGSAASTKSIKPVGFLDAKKVENPALYTIPHKVAYFI